ncbi:uncharacterized protein [Miscanthus floridulus]|uniref:uncharacterized protein isoform X1 n=2 Tax=Miscanthus floridulus TaxID=154761 RepID=UPI00345B2A7E
MDFSLQIGEGNYSYDSSSPMNATLLNPEKQEAVRKLMETSGSFPYQDLGLMIFVAHSKVQEGGHECLLHHGSQGEAGHSQQLHRPNILLRVLMGKHTKKQHNRYSVRTIHETRDRSYMFDILALQVPYA